MIKAAENIEKHKNEKDEKDSLTFINLYYIFTYGKKPFTLFNVTIKQ